MVSFSKGSYLDSINVEKIRSNPRLPLEELISSRGGLCVEDAEQIIRNSKRVLYPIIELLEN